MHILVKKWQASSSSLAWFVRVFLALLPVFGYTIYVLLLHRDLPIYDDYMIQAHVAQLKATPDWSSKLEVLFSQLNEHRLAYTRFWFWLVHALNGTLSYSALILIGNLPLLGIWGVFIWLLYQLKVSPAAFLPLSWLLFQFQYHSNSLWAMASLQNITIHFLYSLLFILLLSSRRMAWWASWGVAIWLCYTSGNGFLALAIGGGALLYQRRWRDALLWTGLTAGLIVTYFWSYQRPADFPVADTNTWFDKLLATFIFLGTHLDAYPNSSPYRFFVLDGLIICVPVFLLTVWGGWRLAVMWWHKQALNRLDQVLLTTLLMVGFIVISALAAVQNRLNFATWEGMTDSRYRLYSTMLLMTGYVQLLVFFRQRQWATYGLGWTGLGLSAVLWAGIFYRQIGVSYLFRDYALAYYHNWTHFQTKESQAFHGTAFKPSGREKATLDRLKKEVSLDVTKYPVSNQAIQKLTNMPGDYVIDNENYVNSQLPSEWNMFVFWAKDHFLIFPVQRKTNPNKRSFWFDRNWFGRGFQAHVIKWRLDTAAYQIGLLTNRSDSLTIYQTQHQVQP